MVLRGVLYWPSDWWYATSVNDLALCAPYALSGTDLADGATRPHSDGRRHLQVLLPIVLRILAQLLHIILCHTQYWPMQCLSTGYARPTRCTVLTYAMLLLGRSSRSPSPTLSSTATTPSGHLSAYARATRCPVLTFGMLLRPCCAICGSVCCYAMPGTELGYAATTDAWH
eukprot:2320647-Rhodomonas_salina.4